MFTIIGHERLFEVRPAAARIVETGAASGGEAGLKVHHVFALSCFGPRNEVAKLFARNRRNLRQAFDENTHGLTAPSPS